MSLNLALAALLLSAAPLHAEGLVITDAMIAPAPAVAPTRAAYVAIRNDSDAPRVLVGVEADGFGMAHLHESRETGGVMTMTPLAQIEIAPGGALEMEQGGLHVMLMHPSGPLTAETVSLRFIFADGEVVGTEAPVMTGPMMEGHGAHGHEGHGS